MKTPENHMICRKPLAALDMPHLCFGVGGGGGVFYGLTVWGVCTSSAKV